MLLNPYEKLANAIIIQAAKDYRLALRRFRNYPNKAAAKNSKRKIEQFFRSDWYGMLTNIDPDVLIRRLNEEVLENE